MGPTNWKTRFTTCKANSKWASWREWAYDFFEPKILRILWCSLCSSTYHRNRSIYWWKGWSTIQGLYIVYYYIVLFSSWKFLLLQLFNFKPTEPLKANWTGTLKNDDLNILCLTTQTLPASYQNKNYSEDCLFLNIFVPGTPVTFIKLKEKELNKYTTKLVEFIE